MKEQENKNISSTDVEIDLEQVGDKVVGGMKLTPLGDRTVIKKYEAEGTTKSGLS